MRKWVAIILSGVCLLTLMSFTTHKFYVSIYQIEFSAEKKRLEITSRIFIDDINEALKQAYQRPVHMGEPTESASDREMFRKYMDDRFQLVINGRKYSLKYHSSEVEGNILISYFSIPGIDKIQSIKVSNHALMEIYESQQNIIQFEANKVKRSLLLTGSDNSGTVTF